jgi:phage FluMu protein Com
MDTERTVHPVEVACAKCGQLAAHVRRVGDLDSGKLYDEFKCNSCGELTFILAPDDEQRPLQPPIC